MPQNNKNYNWSQLIQSKGHPVQEYEVTTEDGYILEIQRIPWGRNGAPVDKTSTTPVLVQHGILASSADFVNNFYNQSLGFLLADAGYDVWLGNSRGNTYTSHVNLSQKGREFWNFSADEIMIYDLPAMIDAVLRISGQEKLQYIGWSQGAQILFELLSERPEFNNKITLFSGMAPVAYLGHLRAPLRVLLPFEDILALVRCDCFQKYDFGSFGNKEKYGKVNPPQHQLSNTKLPVAIYWSDGDELVTTKDVARLRSELPNVVAFYKVPDDKFTHLDFAWGITSANVLYREMIDLMDKYK
ncbi:lipase 3-like [Ixodes scapularis]|uniref:lipase 3-like n=1 Tax=Ixodes scapularis TaxID=6945 RepID=UPI001C390641|nr:lipase 3-like [Ixodes scapularis]